MAARHFLSIFLDALFPPRQSEKIVRDLQIEDISQYLLPTFFETEKSERITSLLPYQELPIKSLIQEAKYHGSTKAWNILGQVLSDLLIEHIEEENALQTTKFILIPIPLSEKRKRVRGYNQSEEICKAALKIAPYFSLHTELLKRTRDTLPQTKLDGAARRTNMQNAFTTTLLDPSSTYIVVDDVVTTGTTLLSAMEALRLAGAPNVSGLALAH